MCIMKGDSIDRAYHGFTLGKVVRIITDSPLSSPPSLITVFLSLILASAVPLAPPASSLFRPSYSSMHFLERSSLRR